MTCRVPHLRTPHIELLLALAAACGGPTPAPHIVLDGGSVDAAVFLSDSEVHCTTAADCDDGVGCTIDRCLSGIMVCGHVGVDGRCDDGVFCNGFERCDLAHDCQHELHQTCDDGNVCTTDRCDEATAMCQHGPRDLDDDGDADSFCGGGDCNDFDQTIASTVPETCDDMIDNDCDNVVDESSAGMECVRPSHDTCSDPLAITMSGTFELRAAGAAADYTIGCDSFGRQPDVVASLTLTEPHDVRITGRSDTSSIAMALRTNCADARTETSCSQGFPAEMRRRSLGAHTYYLIAQTNDTNDLTLTVELTDPTMPPTNETCATPTLIPATGGHFSGSLVDVSDDLATSCSFGGDLVYQLDLPTDSDVSITTASTGLAAVGWELRTTCATSAGALRCADGMPASGVLHQLPMGTYFIVLESYAPADFTLDVVVSPETPPVHGDQCGDPIELAVGVPYNGTLVGAEDDYPTSCGTYYRDVVHRFTLDAPSDVTIDVDGGAAYLAGSLRATCTSEASEVRCDSGRPEHTVARGLPAGSYYFLVEGYRAVSYALNVAVTTPPTAAIRASGND